MREHSLTLCIVILLAGGCNKSAPKSGEVKHLLASGSKLYSYTGNCPEPLPASAKPDGYFALEKGEFVVAVTSGPCRSRLGFHSRWLQSNRVSLSKPRKIEGCAELKVDSKASMILQFDRYDADVRLFSSQRNGCNWMKWTEG